MAPDLAADPKIRLTKMDAARRQLQTAIRLWFADDDPVSIHTLAAASHEILNSLYKLRGLSDLIFDSEVVVDEYRKEWITAIRAVPNFFKHADRDPEATLDFAPATNEFLILFCITALSRMGEDQTCDEHAMVLWIMLNRPNLVKKGAYTGIPEEGLEFLRSRSKAEFREAHAIPYDRRTKSAMGRSTRTSVAQGVIRED
jgi:hypothetical protein